MPVNTHSYDSGGNSFSSWTVSFSPTPTSGNLLVALGIADKNITFSNVPTGWTRIVSDIAVSAGVSSQAIYKISDGTETGVTFTATTSQSCAGVCAEYSGASYATLDVTSSNSNATASTSLSTGTTATTSQANAIAIAMFGADSAQNVDLTRSYATGYTEQIFTGTVSAGTPSAQLADKVLSATGTQSCTFSTTDTGDQLLGILAVFMGADPVITDVNTTESWTDGATGLVITGTNFV
jgi:hypothetical protein